MNAIGTAILCNLTGSGPKIPKFTPILAIHLHVKADAQQAPTTVTTCSARAQAQSAITSSASQTRLDFAPFLASNGKRWWTQYHADRSEAWELMRTDPGKAVKFWAYYGGILDTSSVKR